MTHDEISKMLRAFVAQHDLPQPLVRKRRTPYGWNVVFTLPTEDAADAARTGAAYALALSAPLHYGAVRVFGDWEIQDYTAEGRIGPHITARIRVVGILARIDRPVTVHEEYEAQLAA